MWKRELSFAVTAIVFLGFNLLNARRGVKPTLATLGALLVVVIRSSWIFAKLLAANLQLYRPPYGKQHLHVPELPGTFRNLAEPSGTFICHLHWNFWKPSGTLRNLVPQRAPEHSGAYNWLKTPSASLFANKQP